jgi:Ca2+-binding RTX toxin-like protein
MRILVAVTLVLSLALPAFAYAGTVSHDTQAGLQFEAAPGERNFVELQRTDDGILVRDRTSELEAGGGCTQRGAHEAFCNAVGLDSVPDPTCIEPGADCVAGFGGVRLGDRADQFRTTGREAVGRLHINGGSGDDRLAAGTSASSLFLDGREGDDELVGGSSMTNLSGWSGADRLVAGSGGGFLVGGDGPDVLLGSSGRESLHGGNGPDRMRGGAGDDSLRPGMGRDFVKGGPGVDRVTYLKPVTVTLDRRANDGMRGERDNVQVEEIVGSSGDDVLVGNSGRNYIEGGAGNDVLRGGAGDDILDASTDREAAEDHDVARCGAGSDAVEHDPGTDKVAADCERPYEPSP